jgi:hypothetical protein
LSTQVAETGGTLFVDGSHKAAYPPPSSLTDIASPLWSRYSCPAGSLVIFAEATCHSHSPMPAAGVGRVAIFSRYNHVQTKWHNWEPHPDVLAAMPPMRQTLFRPAHFAGNVIKDGDTI